MRPVTALLLLCALTSLFAGCASEPPVVSPELRASVAGPDDDEAPSDPATVVAQAVAAGAKVETIRVLEDRSMLPSACVANPVNGCLGGNSWAELTVDRAGIDRWAVQLTVTWTATTDLTRSLEGRAQMYYECGFGCRAGGDETIDGASVAPLAIDGVLDEAPADAKGLWLIVRAPSNLPGGSHGNASQDVHIEGTVTAIDDP